MNKVRTDSTSLWTKKWGAGQIHQSTEEEERTTPVAPPGSIAELIAAFRRSSEFTNLKLRVKKLYLGHFNIIMDKLGEFPASALSRRVILELQDSFSKTPPKSNNIMRTISRLYSFGVQREMVTHNPALGIKKLKIGEHRPWKETEIEKLFQHSGLHIKVALYLGIYTGQRLGDIIAMRWSQITDGGIEVVQEKGGAKVWIPLHENLRSLLSNLNNHDPNATILRAPRGGAFTNHNFKHVFKRASRAAGLPEDCVFHGLRKTAAVMLAEAGCSTEQVKSITGHKTDQMAAYYVRQANQRILARAAMNRLEAKNVQPK